MTFTDDDLKRLKNCAYPTPNDNWIGLFNNVSKSYEKFNLNDLLARLEAAERVIEKQDIYDQTFDVQDNTGYQQIHELERAKREWRKAAGK